MYNTNVKLSYYYEVSLKNELFYSPFQSGRITIIYFKKIK